MTSPRPPHGDPTGQRPAAPTVIGSGDPTGTNATTRHLAPPVPGAAAAPGTVGSGNGAPAGTAGRAAEPIRVPPPVDVGELTGGDADRTVAIARPAPSPGDSLTQPWPYGGTGPVVPYGASVRHRWSKIAARTLSKAWGDSLFGMSSQAAFWCALSTAPLLLALLGLMGYIVQWFFPPGTIDDVREQVLLFLNTIFDQEVADNLVGNTVDTILAADQADKISVGLLISLWAGSSAMSAFVEAITIAYSQHEVRSPVVERFFALGLYLLALGAGIVMLPLLAIGPEYLPKLFPDDWEDTVSSIVNVAYYPVLALGLIFLLAVLYKVAPKHKHPWYRGLPGAFLAAAVFFVASFGLRLYLAYAYSNGLTYGALATPITFLLFYYFVSMAIIIGAQFNNAMLEYYPPRVPRRELRRWRRYDPERDAEPTPTLSSG